MIRWNKVYSQKEEEKRCLVFIFEVTKGKKFSDYGLVLSVADPAFALTYADRRQIVSDKGGFLLNKKFRCKPAAIASTALRWIRA